jgi:hypothetical protein
MFSILPQGRRGEDPKAAIITGVLYYANGGQIEASQMHVFKFKLDVIKSNVNVLKSQLDVIKI